MNIIVIQVHFPGFCFRFCTGSCGNKYIWKYELPHANFLALGRRIEDRQEEDKIKQSKRLKVTFPLHLD